MLKRAKQCLKRTFPFLPIAEEQDDDNEVPEAQQINDRDMTNVVPDKARPINNITFVEVVNHRQKSVNSNVSEDKDLKKALEKHRNPLSAIEIILSQSSVENIPLTISNFHNLTILRLQENKLREIPWTFVYLQHLQVCDLSSNCLSEISPIMGYIPTLEELYLKHNTLTYLPTSLLKLSHLQVLDVTGNCNLVSPPMSVCTEGKDAIFSALRKRHNRVDMYSEVTPWYNEHFKVHHFQSLDYVKSVSSLMQIAVDCILECRVNYLSQVHVPPTLKNFLLRTEQSCVKQFHISKCSTCGGFFTNEHNFKNHHCKRIRITLS